MKPLDSKTKKAILRFQKNEITEYHIYGAISHLVKDEHNRSVIKEISDQELRHYKIWEKYSGQQVKPDKLKAWFYIAISAVFGVTFGIKLLEKGEENAQVAYGDVSNVVPEAADIQGEENEHENALMNMIDEEKLRYIGSMVLGLNDALVEFTGALAGFTLALQDSRLIGMTGLIMGFSASLSMAASEYLSTRTEETERSPVKAALYTGTAYVLTVLFLIFPYFLFQNHYSALGLTIGLAIFLILLFNFYFSVVKEIAFKRRFFEMLALSMGVAALSFLIGLAVKRVWHGDV